MSRQSLIIPAGVKIKNPPGFESLDFSTASEYYLALPKAVMYEPDFGGQLQSAREAAAFRIAMNSRDCADDYPANRTPAIHFAMDGKMYVAFDDSTDPTKNILLARAQEGYNAHTSYKEWLVSVDDPMVKETIERAVNAGRHTPSPEMNERELRLDGEYASDAMVRAILTDIAGHYERFLREVKGHKTGFVYDLTAEDCKNLGVDGSTVSICCVGFGDDDFDYDYLNAYDHMSVDGGRARRVRDIGDRS